MSFLRQTDNGEEKGLRTVITTEPTTEPISTTEFKAYAKIDYTDDDTIIAEMIKAARKWSEEYIGRKIINTTVTAHWANYERYMSLPFPPHISITYVKTTSQGVATALTLDSDYYFIENYDYVLEMNSIYNTYGLQVQYVCGYSPTSANVPQSIRYAIMKIVANMYEHRNDFVSASFSEVPFEAKALLQPFRIIF